MVEDKTGIVWHDPMYPWALSRLNALAYFENSPFFDPNSNNAEARARGLDPSDEAVLRSLPPDRPEFVLVDSQEPHLFVIKRQQRSALTSGRTTSPASFYYILDRLVYQAPSLAAVVGARLQRAMHHVHSGLAAAERDLAPLPRLSREMAREAAAAAAAAPDRPALPVPVREALSREEQRYWEQTDEVIMRVLSRYPMPHLPGEAQQQQQAPDFAATAPQAETPEAEQPQRPDSAAGAGAAATPPPAAGSASTAAAPTAGPGPGPGPSTSSAGGGAPAVAPRASSTPAASDSGATPAGSSLAQPSRSDGPSILAGSTKLRIKLRLPGGGEAPGQGRASGGDERPPKRARP